MTIISKPKVNINIIPGQNPTPNTGQKVLIVAQKTSAGTAVAGELYSPVAENTEDTLGGLGSMAAHAIEGFRLTNGVNNIDAIFLDDPAGVAAEGDITFTGTATAAGTYTITSGEARNGKATVSVIVGDDLDDVATKVAAAYATLTKCLCAVAVDGVTTSQVNFTARNVGLEGNFIGLGIEGTIAGLTYVVTGMTGGTLVPTLTNVFDVVGTTRYQTIPWPQTYGYTDVTAFLDPRFNADGKIQDGMAIVTDVDSAANIGTDLDSLNSPSLDVECMKAESVSDYKGPTNFEYPLTCSAMIAGARARRLTDGANISDLVIATASNDQSGGPAIASLPYFNTPLPIPVARNGFGFTELEVTTLNGKQGSVFGNNTGGTAVIMGGLRTTYKTDAASNPDATWQFANYVDTSSQAREYMWNNARADCAQARLTDGNLAAGRSIQNENSIRGLFIGYYGTLSSDEYTLLRSGETARNFFIDNLDVILDLDSGTATVTGKLPIVTQLREIDSTFQVIITNIS